MDQLDVFLIEYFDGIRSKYPDYIGENDKHNFVYSARKDLKNAVRMINFLIIYRTKNGIKTRDGK